ncbi:hypothetical protein HDV57DRAFT_511076 [Trichoderma longibrachiatum]
MDDSYSNPVKRAQTSLSAQTQPTTYQVNVSRKKTRKWVEAKVQNYDGDDWGADEFEQESDEEPVPPPPINPSLRTFSGTDLIHSRHNTPSPASSLSALPSLRSQSQQQQQPAAVPPPAGQPPRIGVSSPDVSDVSIRSAPESIASGHAVSPQSATASQGRDGDSNLSLAGIAQLPSQMQQPDQQQQTSGGYDVSRSSSFERSIKPMLTPTPTPPVGDRSLSPHNAGPSPPPADQSTPVIYSPDNYSRLNDVNEHETLALAPVIPPTIGGDRLSDSAPQPLSGVDRRDTWERDYDSLHSNQPDNQTARLDIESQAGIDRGRMSVSPKLPDLARMSAFGADLFSSSSNKNASVIPPVIESSPDIPSANQSRWQPPAVPAEDDDHSEATGGAPLSQPDNLLPGRNIPDIPPLQTPSPHATHAADALFDSPGTKITPTEPLQPGRGEALPDLDQPQAFHRVQTYSTAESSPSKDSPVKESDVLSDEIMRTLSPSGATPAEVKLSDGPQLHPPEDRSAVRESSYTLMDYDSYWADTADDAGLAHENASVPQPEDRQSDPSALETDPARSAQPGLQLATNSTPPPPQANTLTFDSILSPQQSQQSLKDQPQQQNEQQPPSSLRRRFSWEEEAQRTPTPATPAQAQAAGDGSSTSALHLKPFEPSVTNQGSESRSHSPVSQLSQAPPTATGSGLGALALQTSGALPGHDSSLPEPPSPVSVSVKSDSPSTSARDQARLSIADEKLLAEQGAISLVTGTPPPPPESHPALSSPTSAASVPAPQAPAPNSNPHAQTKAMGFREIMGLSTPAERIAKYNEARQALAARESGLQSWLLYMTTEHPELSASISAPGGHLTLEATNNASLPAGYQASSQQQPYYQQYLNASSPSTSVPQVGGGGGGGSGGGGGRSRLGGLSMPSQMSGSAFSHSGNQIGTKSKEFMHSAGKMGKGLGDKVDIIAPDHPTPSKAQRRSTWRFSLEPRPREDDPAPHSSDDISTTPPQLPDPSPVSPLDAASGPGSDFPWSVSNDTPAPDPSAVKQPGEEHVRSGGILIGNDSLHGLHGENMSSAGQQGLSDLPPDTVTPDDWVMVQHQGERSQANRMSSSFRAMPQSQNQGQPQLQDPPLEEGSGAPRRNSSFIGLPPIRRGSTFGTKSKARRASERFALDDDDDDDDVGGFGGDGADIHDPPCSPTGAIDASKHASEAVAGAEPRFGPEQTTNAGHPHYPNPQQPRQPQQPGQQQQRGEHFPDQHGPQFVAAAPTLGSLVQKLPPAGPWKLEESHLAEPLHLTKKRSGTDFAQQNAYYGYDKELGLEYPAAPVPAPQGPPSRIRSDFKIGPGHFSRASTSNSAFESAGDGRDGGAAHKRRISDIAKASGITGLFSRSRQDRASLGAIPRQPAADPRQNPQMQHQAATVSRPSIQLPSLDFASDRLGSMSSLGFEESFQSYGREADDEEKKRQQQHALEQPAQRSFGDFQVLPAAEGQERLAASTGFALPQATSPSQIMAVNLGRQNAETHQPPLLTATPEVRANMPQTGRQGVNPAAAEGQRAARNMKTSPAPQADSTTEEKTPKAQEFVFQGKQPPLPVKGDDVSEEDVLRSQTVSPDISIISTSKTEEQASVQKQSHVPEHDEIVEGILITPPPEAPPLASDTGFAAGRSIIHRTVSNDVPPSVHSFPSVSSLRERPDAKSVLLSGSSAHQTEGTVALSPEPSPEVAKSEVSSRAATPASQHQQLHPPALAAIGSPDTQHADHPATPRSHARSESSNPPIDAAGQRNLPTSASPQLTGSQAPQQLRPQYPPSVSLSNASVASEVSTPMRPVQSVPQRLTPGFPGPFGRASTQPPEAATQQQDGQASRWKGLKNRLTEQISQGSQQPQLQQQQQQSLIPGQNKTAVVDKIRGNKLLGALRRTSKQVESTQSQGTVQSSPRQFQNPAFQPQPQGYQPQPGQLQEPQRNAMPATGQYLQASGQPPNLPRAKTMSPVPPQQSAPPRNQTRSSEPRYETVPIPRGYAAVHGEGSTIPSPYHQNLRRQMPHGQFAPLPQQLHPLQQHPHPHPPVPQQQQWQGPPLIPHHQLQAFQSPPPQGPVSAPMPHERSAHMRASSDSRAEFHDALRTDSHSSQGSRVEPRPTSDLGSNLGVSHPGSPQPSETGNLSPAVSVGADQKPGTMPEPKTDVAAEPTAASNLGIDVERARQLVDDNLYDATPRAAGGSRPVPEEGAESSGSAEAKPGLPPVSSEARKRAIRLASQEEKIYYEPEDDEPKMSATSYPGQEWNPFGEPEFADWKED